MSSDSPLQSLITRADAIYDAWEAGTLNDDVALHELDEVIGEARKLEQPGALLSGLNNRTIILRYIGAFDQTLQTNQELYEIALHHNNQLYLSWAALCRGDVFRLQAKYEMARDAFREAYRFAHAAQDYLAEAYALQLEAVVVLATKQIDNAQMLAEKGLSCIDQYIESASRRDPIYSSLQSSLYQLLARCALAQGSVQTGWEHARQALERAQKRNSFIEIGNTYHVFADLAAFAPDQIPADLPTDLDHYYVTAISHFRTAGAEPEIASTSLEYARSLHQRGRTAEAIPLLEEATSLLKRLQRAVDFFSANSLLNQYRKLLA